MNAVCANPATTLARRLAACVNAKTQDDKARADGYRQDATQLRSGPTARALFGEADNTMRNAADLLDDWATQLYRKVGP